MNMSLRNITLISALPILLRLAFATGLSWQPPVDAAPAVKEAAAGPAQKRTKVSVEPLNDSSMPHRCPARATQTPSDANARIATGSPHANPTATDRSSGETRE
jgi:hypothetical protein